MKEEVLTPSGPTPGELHSLDELNHLIPIAPNESASFRVRKGCSRAEAIFELKLLATELKRTPSFDDIREGARRGTCPSCSVYTRLFGSIREAQIAAELSPNTAPKIWKNDEALEALRKCVMERGFLPTKRSLTDAARKGLVPYPHRFKELYPGGFIAALRSFGVSTRRAPQSRNRDQLISDLKELAAALGRSPVTADINTASKEGRCACLVRYLTEFGSIANALAAAEIVPEKASLRRSRSRLLKDLSALAEEIGSVPGVVDVVEGSKRGVCATSGTYISRFGSMERARRHAGLTPSMPLSPEMLIRDLRLARKILGRTPAKNDLSGPPLFPGQPSLTEYIDAFGTFPRALVQAGLLSASQDPDVQRAKAIRALQRLRMSCGDRAITGADIHDAYRAGNFSAPGELCRLFGSLEKAIHAAEVDI